MTPSAASPSRARRRGRTLVAATAIAFGCLVGGATASSVDTVVDLRDTDKPAQISQLETDWFGHLYFGAGKQIGRRNAWDGSITWHTPPPHAQDRSVLRDLALDANQWLTRGRVWYINGGVGYVDTLRDPAQAPAACTAADPCDPPAQIRTTAQPRKLAFGSYRESRFLYATTASNRLLRIDTTTTGRNSPSPSGMPAFGEIALPLPTGASATGITGDRGSMYITNDRDDSVLVLDEATGQFSTRRFAGGVQGLGQVQVVPNQGVVAAASSQPRLVGRMSWQGAVSWGRPAVNLDPPSQYYDGWEIDREAGSFTDMARLNGRDQRGNDTSDVWALNPTQRMITRVARFGPYDRENSPTANIDLKRFRFQVPNDASLSSNPGIAADGGSYHTRLYVATDDSRILRVNP